MDRSHYSTTLTFSVPSHDPRRDDVEVEIDVTVSFAVSVGCPASYRGPAEDDEVSDITLVQIGDRFRPWNLNNWSDGHIADLVAEKLFDSETHLERMLEKAAEDAADTEDRLDEARWEARREASL